MLIWAALKVTVHATIQLKLIFSFLLFLSGEGRRACLVWFGFLSGFPGENPLPGEKNELCEAPPAALLPHPHGSGDRSQCTFTVRSHGFHQDVFSLYVSHPFIDLFFFIITQARQHLSAGRAARSHPGITGKHRVV